MKRKKGWDGNLKIWDFTISLNTILTSVLGTIACAGVGVGLHYLSSFAANVNSIPKLRTDVDTVLREQARVRKEYHPPLSANDPPPPAAAK